MICNCAYVLSEGHAGSICTISISNEKPVSDGGNDCPPVAEAAANARLIAAAPELLSVVRDMFDNPDARLMIGGNPAFVDALVARAHAVLAKASPANPGPSTSIEDRL